MTLISAAYMNLLPLDREEKYPPLRQFRLDY